MKITEIAVRRPITGIMFFLILTVLGVFTFSRLQLDMLPDLEFPVVAIIVQYPGADPQAVEHLVTGPIEEAVASVENVERIETNSTLGASVTMVFFRWGTEMAKAEERVRKNIDLFTADRLPDESTQPLIFAFDPALAPVVFLTLNAPGLPSAVRSVAEDHVKPRLQRLPGVAAVEVFGGAVREIEVRLWPEWMQVHGISVQQVVGALRGGNVLLPGGTIIEDAEELTITADVAYTSIEQVADTIVGMGMVGGTGPQVPVRLRDVADVIDTFREVEATIRANGEDAVMIAVRKQSDANTVEVSRRVIAALPGIEEGLAAGAALQPVFNQGEPILLSLSNLARTAMLALFLTALVLLGFLRSWRTSSIVLVSIPLALLSAFALMDFQDVTLNIVSMAGLALAVGMLVDNSIVVLENIFRHREKGAGPQEAAIDGTAEVAMPITASTLTTISVFAPVLFVPGLAGQMFRDMSLTICFALFASLVVSLTLSPLLASLFFARPSRETFLQRRLAWMGAGLERMGDVYGDMLNRAMQHPKKVLLGAGGVFAFALALSPLLGADFMAAADDGSLQFQVRAAPGSSLRSTDRFFRQAEAIVAAEVPEALVAVSQFGGEGEGISALFGQNSYSGDFQLRLTPLSQRSRGVREIERALRGRFEEMPGVEFTVRQPGMMGTGGDVTVKVFGDDLDELRTYGERLRGVIEAIPGAANVEFALGHGRPELGLEVDRDRLVTLGLSAADVAGAVSAYFMGAHATNYREAGNEYRIFVRAHRAVRENTERLLSIPVALPVGGLVPLHAVADVKPAMGPTTITRENQRRVGHIYVNADGVPLGTLIKRLQAAVAEFEADDPLPTLIAGAAEDFQDSFIALGLAFLVAVLLVYMVMASQFESLREPFVIMFTVPLAISGVIFSLLLTGTTLQVTALIGVILLSGIVVNNGIVLIDIIKQRRLAGTALDAAVREGGQTRLRPVLMTALTTILGMLPLAFEWGEGAEVWAPMGRAVIGGMVVATALTLVVIPTAYYWLSKSKGASA